MLYFLYGTDTKASRAKLHELLDTLHKKKPDASVFKIEPDNFESARFDELLGGQGLFENKYIVVCDKLFENAEAKEQMVTNAKEMSESDNVFLCLEENVDAPTLKKIEKHAQKTQEFEEKKKAVGKSFNIFSLTDALGRRDKKELWVLYQQALASGSEPEEIHGILFWQIKSMLLASQSKSADEAGLKPFVFQKASGFSKKYSPAELRAMSARFVEIYHNARRGISEMGVGLEKFILSV